MILVLRAVGRSAGLYPITSVFLVAVALACCVTQRWISIPAAVLILGMVTVVCICWSAWHELRSVHALLLEQSRREAGDRADIERRKASPEVVRG